jgi:epoxyqueuosine reductase
VLDATRCISYLTIENKDLPPQTLRSGIGSWVFGCDVCQEVCPWNRKAQLASSDELPPKQKLLDLNLESVLAMTEEEFRSRYRKTPLWRSKLVGIQRNALIAMTNQRHFRTQRWAEVFINHPNSLLRLIAAWSLKELATDSSQQRLQQAIREESDAAIAQEMRALLA